MRLPRRLAAYAGTLLALGLASCDVDDGVGLCRDQGRSALGRGSALSRRGQARAAPQRQRRCCARRSARAKLQTDVDGGQLALLCNIEVKKNRITSVTVSVMSRQPRCQCGRPSGTDAAANRTCIG